MPETDLFLNRAVVLAGAVVYWAGVFVQARRVRRHIGHSPNVKPRGAKENLLWAGWILVVAAWLALPFLAGHHASSPLVRIIPALEGGISLVLGILVTAAGYAGTLWCYAAMGDTWRMGVDRSERTTLVQRGPYRVVRHPIYLFQILMLTGAALLLPTLLALLVLLIHIICIATKAADEENYLRSVHGQRYLDYLSRSGRFFPKLRPKSKS